MEIVRNQKYHLWISVIANLLLLMVPCSCDTSGKNDIEPESHQTPPLHKRPEGPFFLLAYCIVPATELQYNVMVSCFLFLWRTYVTISNGF